MIITIIILVLAALFFASGKIRSDIVALCALLCLMFFGILTPSEALSGFSSTVVIMMAGLFVVGGAVMQTGLAKKVSGKIVGLAGTNETILLITIMLVTAIIGGFVSNTGTVALMMPIVVSIASKAGIGASRLLMPLAFASSMGGMLTLIGTPPNLVIQDVLSEAGYDGISFFTFTPIGLIGIAIGVAVLLPLSRIFLNKKNSDKQKGGSMNKSLSQLVKEYGLNENLSKFKITAESKAKGKTITELDIQHNYNLTVIEVRRETTIQKGIITNVEQKIAESNTVLMENDIIYLSGSKNNAAKFAEDFGLSRDSAEQKYVHELSFYDIGIAEIVLMPHSTVVKQIVRDVGFREKYSINIIGIRRADDYIMDNLAYIRLQAGDVLLVQGTWANIARLSSDEDHWVVLGQPLEEAAKVTLDYKAPLAAGIMLLMIVAMVFDFIPIAPVTAVIAAAVLMVLTGCFRNVEAAYKTINWESLVLIAAMMPMSEALEKTGASAMISHSLVDVFGNYGPLALLAGLYLTTSLLSLFISNTATAVLMAPIALSSAIEMGVNPYPMLFAVAVSASMCFATPFSTPPNALVMQAGQYSFMDYVKVGLPLQIIMAIIMVFVLPMVFPF